MTQSVFYFLRVKETAKAESKTKIHQIQWKTQHNRNIKQRDKVCIRSDEFLPIVVDQFYGKYLFAHSWRRVRNPQLLACYLASTEKVNL